MTLKPFFNRIRPIGDRPRKVKALTIGIGFSCSNGLVICADTEVGNGQMKFEENKIFPSGRTTTDGRKCGVAITYAGSSAALKTFRDKFDAILGQPGFNATGDNVELALDEALQKTGSALFDGSSEPDLYLLCGIMQEGQKPILLKTQADKIHHVREGFDFVGVGDSSILRFLADVFYPRRENLTVVSAVKIGVYAVELAKAYISGCGGRTDILFIAEDGTIGVVDAMAPKYASETKVAEVALRNVLLSVRDARVSSRELSKDGARFVEELKRVFRRDLFDDEDQKYLG